MDRKSRVLDSLLDSKEEVILVGLLKCAAEGEQDIEELRQHLCSDPTFDPYVLFRSLSCGATVLSPFDLSKWLNRQFYKNTLLDEKNVQNVLKRYAPKGAAGRKAAAPFSGGESSAVVKYEGFLKMILPREERGIRNLVMCRRPAIKEGSNEYLHMGTCDMSRDAGFNFVRLLELEANLYEELVIRKKRMVEYQWRENRKQLAQRSFTWLQSQSAVPGVCHVSVLGVCRLLSDDKQIMAPIEVERVFHRINLGAENDMLSYSDWDAFLYSAEADIYVSELYVKYFCTFCPGCGAMCQRDGGACNNITCAFCRTTFRCDTKSQDAPAAPGKGEIMLVSQSQSPRAANRASRGYNGTASRAAQMQMNASVATNVMMSSSARRSKSNTTSAVENLDMTNASLAFGSRRSRFEHRRDFNNQSVVSMSSPRQMVEQSIMSSIPVASRTNKNGGNHYNVSLSRNASRRAASSSTRIDYSTLSRNSTANGGSSVARKKMQNYREKAASHTASLMSPRGFAPKPRGVSAGIKTGMNMNNNTSSSTSTMNTSLATASTIAPTSPQTNTSNLFDDSNDNISSDDLLSAAGIGFASPRGTNISRSYISNAPRYGGTPSASRKGANNNSMIKSTSANIKNNNYSGGASSTLSSPSAGRFVPTASSPLSPSFSYVYNAKVRRQHESLNAVLDVMFQQIDLDNCLEAEKEKLWQDGINVEAVFTMLDRYQKRHIADTDMWQLMHGSEFQGKCSYAGICALFREIKGKNFSGTRSRPTKDGQLSLAELTQFLFPRQSEEWQNVYDDMSDAETKNVLFVTRSTISCPGCGMRTQRTVEGCPQVTCPSCRTVFRCNLVGDDRDHVFRLTATQKHQVRAFIQFAVGIAEEQEELRKKLLNCGSGTGESLSSLLLDAFLLISGDKGYMTMQDMKKAVLSEKAVRGTDIELLWHRYARTTRRIGYVEFAHELRPWGMQG
ncbi:unnamed protein product [Amoebophrya sp. A25]|nr:unnamed protein product [Amoebophrya sp. A25]|eukprot:GSA25T00006486001.1